MVQKEEQISKVENAQFVVCLEFVMGMLAVTTVGLTDNIIPGQTQTSMNKALKAGLSNEQICLT